MKYRKYLIIVVGILASVSFLLLIPPLFIKNWVRNKLEKTSYNENTNYIVEVDRVKASIIPAGLELTGIIIYSRNDTRGNIVIKGEISSLKLKGISLVKAIFKKEIKIRKVIITEGYIKYKISSNPDQVKAIVMPMGMKIKTVRLDRMNLEVMNPTNAASFTINNFNLRLYKVMIEKHDTLSYAVVTKFGFLAEELISVSADSMYLYKCRSINFSEKTNSLIIDSISIHPNFKNYDFTSRYKEQKNRLEAGLSNISIHDFDIAEFVRCGSLRISFIELGKADMQIFRDNRKEFHHVNKPEFQDIIYNYTGDIKIDSAAVYEGNITYTEHALEANEPGYLSFNNISARIYKVTNDTIYRTDTAFLVLKANALFMDKSNISILLKARIFDSRNTFSLNGTLSSMEANELNPFLEKKAFLYVSSGKIDNMNFIFSANSQKALGTMIIKYHGLDLAVKNKVTDDTTAIKERLISWVVNREVLNSNPLAGEEVREGIIDFVRDPERSMVHYCGKSILSGIRSSIQRVGSQ